MSLVFNHGSLITVNGAATLNIAPITDLPLDKVDLAVVGIGNFASGNYTQKSSDVTDIVSNFSLSESEIRGAGFYLTSNLPTGLNLTKFGNAIHNSSDNLEIKARKFYGSHNTGTDRKWFADLVQMNGNRELVADANALLEGKGGAGPVLVQAASAALFKQLGKHAAISNDNNISGQEFKMSNDMANAFVETNTNYRSSDIFQAYLGSGRYADDGPDVNTVINYNVVNTSYDFIVQVSGSVSDTSSPADALDIVKILGDLNAAGVPETKVAKNGNYVFNIYMRLQHETDV